jgi:hypothetical protein
MAPRNDFQGEAGLVCPGCAEPLRQIGVDFECPLELLYCNACSTAREAGATQGLCLTCGAEHRAEVTRQKVIFTYHLAPETPLLTRGW